VLIPDLEVVLDIGARLDVLGIPWAVVGSVASSVFGEPRATADVDLVADLRGIHVKKFCAAIASEYYVDEGTAAWAASTRRSFNVIHQGTMVKLDIFCCKDDPLSREQLRRRVFERVDEEDHKIPFTAPEDIILQKLLWMRELGHSEKQWRDALGVLRVRWDELDRDYLEQRARDNDLADVLAKLLEAREIS
jgi:hypothetical protein